MRHGKAYRSAFGLILGAVVVQFWVHGAVGIIGDSDNLANLMYVGVLAVGFVGAVIARFEPNGMSRALFATALAQALVAVIALVAGLDPPAKPMLLILNVFLVSLYLASALLFRHAARKRPVSTEQTDS